MRYNYIYIFLFVIGCGKNSSFLDSFSSAAGFSITKSTDSTVTQSVNLSLQDSGGKSVPVETSSGTLALSVSVANTDGTLVPVQLRSADAPLDVSENNLPLSTENLNGKLNIAYELPEASNLMLTAEGQVIAKISVDSGSENILSALSQVLPDKAKKLLPKSEAAALDEVAVNVASSISTELFLQEDGNITLSAQDISNYSNIVEEVDKVYTAALSDLSNSGGSLDVFAVLELSKAIVQSEIVNNEELQAIVQAEVAEGAVLGTEQVSFSEKILAMQTEVTEKAEAISTLTVSLLKKEAQVRVIAQVKETKEKVILLAPKRLTFKDEDPSLDKIGGTLSLTKPSIEQSDLTHFNIYLATKSGKSGYNIPLTTLDAKGTLSFEIPLGTNLATEPKVGYIWAYGKSATQEGSLGTSVSAVDYFVDQSPPSALATDGIFTDEDELTGTIEGFVQFNLPFDHKRIEGFKIYTGTADGTVVSQQPIATIDKTSQKNGVLTVAVKFTLDSNIKSVLVFATNSHGQSSTKLQIDIVDQETPTTVTDTQTSNPEGSPQVSGFEFHDTDNKSGTISGQAYLNRAENESGINSYAVYYADSEYKKLSVIKEISVTGTDHTFSINESLPDNAVYFAAYTTNSAGELNSDPLHTYIYDLQDLSIFPGEQQWNHYIYRGTDQNIEATDEPATCSSNSSSAHTYSYCVHAGEYIVHKLPYESCEGLTFEDDLEAFRWQCSNVTSDDGIIVYTTGLSPDARLSDLIHFDSTDGSRWKANSLIITSQTGEVSSTSSTVWWNAEIIDVDIGTTLNTPYAVYVLSKDLTQSLNIGVDNITFVTAPDVILTGGLEIEAKFVQVEGNFHGRIRVLESEFVQLNNVKVVNSTYEGITFDLTSKSRIWNTIVSNQLDSETAGIELLYSNSNQLMNINTNNNLGAGIHLVSSSYNLIGGVVAVNNTNGIYLNTSHLNHIFGSTIVNNLNNGIKLYSSWGNVIRNLLISNNDGPGVGIYESTSGGNTVQNTAFTNNDSAVYASNSEYTHVSGKFILSGNTSNCVSLGASNPGFDSNCINSWSSDEPSISHETSNTEFIGPIDNDAQNSFDDSAGDLFSDDFADLDWADFDNSFRLWTSEENYPPETKGYLQHTDPATVFDFRLKSNDSIALNKVNSCPSNEYFGTIQVAYYQYAQALPFTIELMNDGVGNDNFLCESNEDCFLASNFGAYQGHGEFVNADTNISNTLTCDGFGSISGDAAVYPQNINFLKYNINGE